MNLVSLATLGFSPSPPRNVAIANKNTLNNMSQLTWLAPLQGSKVYGYNVLWRQTFESDWTGSVFTTGTSISVPYNKDNYILAVQAVDIAGHTSLPVLAV